MIGWSITSKCNLRCIFCSQNAGQPTSDELTTNQCYSILDQVARYNASIIGFTGGEPFLRRDIDSIVTYAIRRGLRCVITTNGTLLQKIPVSCLVKFIKIRMSLDAPDASLHEKLRGVNNIFSTIIDNIKFVKTLGIKREIVTTIGRYNLQILDEMFSFLTTLKIEEWSLSILTPTGRGSNLQDHCLNPEEYYAIIEKLISFKKSAPFHIKVDIPQFAAIYSQPLKNKGEHYCSAATDLMVIFPDGQVGPCFTLPLTDGNAKYNDLYHIWNTSNLFKLFRDKSLLKSNCCGCELVKQCGGCRAYAYAVTGDLLSGDPLCWHRRAVQF